MSCCTVKRWSFVIAYYSLVTTILGLGALIFLASTNLQQASSNEEELSYSEKSYSVVQEFYREQLFETLTSIIIFFTICVILNIALLVGLHKDKKYYILPWLVVRAIISFYLTLYLPIRLLNGSAYAPANPLRDILTIFLSWAVVGVICRHVYDLHQKQKNTSTNVYLVAGMQEKPTGLDAPRMPTDSPPSYEQLTQNTTSSKYDIV